MAAKASAGTDRQRTSPNSWRNDSASKKVGFPSAQPTREKRSLRLNDARCSMSFIGNTAWRQERAQGVHLLAGVVGAADEGAGLDVGEAEGDRVLPQGGELVGRDVALDGQVAGRGLQVLAERQDVA